MTTPDTLKSTLKSSTIFILIIGGAGMLFLGYYLMSISLNSEYPQIAGLILGCLFGLIGLFSLLYLLTFETLELDKEKLVIRSIFNYTKRIIYLRDIICYNEIEKENKSGKWHNLTVFTDTGKYQLSSSVISNYTQFKPQLTKGKIRNIHSKELSEYRVRKYVGIASVIIGAFFIYGMWNIYNNRDNVIFLNELTTIKATVNNKLEIYKSKSSRRVTIKTKEYPAFIFELYGNTFRASNAELLVANVKNGDQIEIDILTEEYEKKLIKTKPMTFWNKTLNYNLIGLYGIRDSYNTYLTLEASNHEHKKNANSWGFWLFALMGLALAGGGIFLLTKNKRPVLLSN